jgi:hypothetical protein
VPPDLSLEEVGSGRDEEKRVAVEERRQRRRIEGKGANAR